MDPNDPTIDGVRNRPAERCACRQALLAGFGDPAEPVQDLDRTTAGIQDTGVELGLGPEPVSVDRSIGDGRRRGGADQDDADGKGEGSHVRTISGPDVRRNRRTGQDHRSGIDVELADQFLSQCEVVRDLHGAAGEVTG